LIYYGQKLFSYTLHVVTIKREHSY